MNKECRDDQIMHSLAKGESYETLAKRWNTSKATIRVYDFARRGELSRQEQGYEGRHNSTVADCDLAVTVYKLFNRGVPADSIAKMLHKSKNRIRAIVRDGRNRGLCFTRNDRVKAEDDKYTARVLEMRNNGATGRLIAESLDIDINTVNRIVARNCYAKKSNRRR